MPFSRIACSVAASAVLLGLVAVGRPQQGRNANPANHPAPPATTFPDLVPPLDPNPSPVEQRQSSIRNDERQKRLISDTDKLLALATKLQADVAKTDKNMLSMDVIRRAEEIEKLAHSVKERMKS